MQQLALLKMVSERRKLTTVHDVYGAWTGIGAAIHILWKQHKASSSIREVIAVVAYLTMMLVLHIASSSIMQWQAYKDAPFSVDTGVQTNLAMPDSAVNISQLRWAEIFPVARSIQASPQLSESLSGLWKSSLYDVPKDGIPGATSGIQDWGTILVNSTTLTAQCGLVPNLTPSYQDSGEYRISFQNGTNNGSFLESPICKC